MIQFPWNVLTRNPFRAEIFVSIVLNDEKPILESESEIQIISQKIKTIHKHNPKLAI